MKLTFAALQLHASATPTNAWRAAQLAMIAGGPESARSDPLC